MDIPQNGRVIVIDDELEKEALPLINVLSKNGVPVTYFSGLNHKELPEKPLINTRLVFLDIVLGTKAVSSIKNRISKVMSILTRIIAPNNGPYIIVAWTKHTDTEEMEELKKALKNKKIYPVFLLNLGKNVYMKTGESGFVDNALKLIEEKLKEELKKAGAFHLFFLWENLVHKSAGDVVRDFSSGYDSNSTWNDNMLTVFHKLAEAYAGQKLAGTGLDELVKNCLLGFNGLFIDSLENEVRLTKCPESINGFKESKLDKQLIAKINSKFLLIDNEKIDHCQPGNIYELRTNKHKLKMEELFKSKDSYDKYENKDKLLKGVKYIALEISPTCDYAQNKWRSNRLLPGVMWPEEFSCKKKGDKEDALIKSSDYIYKTSVLKFKNKEYKLVFDFRYFTSSPLTGSSRKSTIRIRHPLLIDIQNKLSNHIARPGVLSL